MSNDPATANRTRALLAAGFIALALSVGWFATRTDEAPRRAPVPRAVAGESPPTRDSPPASDIESAAPGAASLAAERPELAATPRLPARSSAISELQLVSVRVRVVDQTGQGPVPGMSVELWSGDGNPAPEDPSVHRAHTNGQGIAAFEFTRERRSSLALAARIAQLGWASPIARVNIPPDGGARGEPVELVLRPELGCVVHGLVFDGESARATDGYVEVRFAEDSLDSKDSPHEPLEHERYPLASDGTFELRLPVNRSVVLHALLADGATGERLLKPVASEPSVYLTLHAYLRGGLSGQLVDLAGRSLPYFQVHAVQRNANESDAAFHLGSRNTAKTGLDGCFAFEGERTRLTLLEVSGPNNSPKMVWRLADNVTPGEVPDATYTLPLVRVSLSARDDLGAPLELVHASGSSFRSGMPPGSDQSIAWKSPSLDSDSQRVHVVPEILEEGGWIHYQGSVPTAEERGRLIDGSLGKLFLPDQDAPPVRQLRFLVEAGHSYNFALRGLGHEDLEEQVWVPSSGEDLEVELHPHSLGSPVDVAFVLLDASGEAHPGPANWTLTTRRPSGRAIAWLPPTDGGPAAVALPPGTYTVTVSFRTGNELTGQAWGLSREVTISPDGPRRFELLVSDAEARRLPRLLFGW